MKKLSKALSVLSAAAIMSAAVPLTSTAYYVKNDNISPFAYYLYNKVDDSGFLGRDQELYIGKDFGCDRDGILPDISGCSYYGYDIIRTIEDRDKFYVRFESVYYNVAEDIAEALTDIFGEESSAEIKEDGYVVIIPDGDENVVYDIIEDIPISYIITITDPDITYSEYLNAVQYCENKPDILALGTITDYYYGPERCHLGIASTKYDHFYETRHSQEEADKVTDFIGSLGYNVEFIDDALTGGWYFSGRILYGDDVSVEQRLAIAARAKEAGITLFSFEAVPAVDLGYAIFDITEEDFAPESSVVPGTSGARSYNELAAMSDKEVIAAYPDFFADERYALFGTDSPLGDKFEAALNQWDYYSLMSAMSNDNIKPPVSLNIKVDEKYDIDGDITAEKLGFPEEWTAAANKGYFVDDKWSGKDAVLYYGGNSYSVSIPFEQITNFETYVRVLLSEEYLDELTGGCSLNVLEITDAEAMPPLLLGDVNHDNKTTVADAVAVSQSIGNADKYGIKDVYTKRIADVDSNPGITAGDALALMRNGAGIENSIAPPAYIPYYQLRQLIPPTIANQ